MRGRLDRLAEEGDNRYAEQPTLTKIKLKNGSMIHCLPAGRTGYFIKGLTVNLLIADEAAYINETVWDSVLPMIALAKAATEVAQIILLSTPFGKTGYYHDAFTDDEFESFHVSTEDCPRMQNEKGKKFLAKELKRMGKLRYRQEYLAEFTDDITQYFPTDLIRQCTAPEETIWDFKSNGNYYLGADFAGQGGDENALVIVRDLGTTYQVEEIITTTKRAATDTIGKIISLDRKYKFNKLFVDDGGLGSPITDLLQEKLGKRRVIGLNNARKRIEVQGEERDKGIFKEDLYQNTLMMMELGEVMFKNSPALMESMKSITFGHSETGRIRIFGMYSHITEALVRALWCKKEKGLNIYLF